MKALEDMTKAELVAVMRRFNPFGNYEAFSVEQLRGTVRRYESTKNEDDTDPRSLLSDEPPFGSFPEER